MGEDKKEARHRYQRRPRNVLNRTHESVPHRSELALIVIVLIAIIVFVWGLGIAYQTGYNACERYFQEVSADV